MNKLHKKRGLEQGGISVIIPCFNSEATITETVESVLSQRIENMEVIVVDDGSGDGTQVELKRFGPAIRYVYQRNQGVSVARNCGVNVASKEWIAFCDADDVWYPDKIKICNEVIRDNENCDFIFHDYSVIYENHVIAERGTHSEHSFFPMLKRYSVTIPQILTQHRRVFVENEEGKGTNIDTYSGNGFEWMILGNFIMPSSVIMKRKLFIEQGGFDRDFKVAEDAEFFLRLAKNTDFLYIDHPLHGYRRSPNSLISRHLKETIVYGIRGVKKNLFDDKETLNKYRKWTDRSLSGRLAALAYYNLTELDTREALRNAIRSIKHKSLSVEAWTMVTLALMPKTVLQMAKDLKRALKKENFVKQITPIKRSKSD